MTGVTGGGCRNVIGGLGMTTGARPVYVGVIHLQNNRKGTAGLVAGFAIITGINMPVGFTRRRDTVMTAGTGTGLKLHNTAMVKRPVGETHRVVAIAAIFRGGDMVRVLAGCGNPIVTILARQDHLTVIHLQGRVKSTAGGVAGTAFVGDIGV